MSPLAMALFRRTRQRSPEPDGSERRLPDDAPRMRAALTAMLVERRRLGDRGAVDLRALVRDLLTGEVAAPTADVASLIGHHVDPDEFYESEIAPSWDGLGEAQRAARLEGFVDLSRMLDEQGTAAGLPEDMAATVHTKTLLLAFAFDETYAYLNRIASGADPD
jgi:hypothetical protein